MPDPFEVVKRKGRRPVKADGTAMSSAERQARRRKRLVDREGILEALITLAEADENMLAAINARERDPATQAAFLALGQAQGDLTELLGVAPCWPVRQLRERQRKRRSAESDVRD